MDLFLWQNGLWCGAGWWILCGLGAKLYHAATSKGQRSICPAGEALIWTIVLALFVGPVSWAVIKSEKIDP
jgi:hypothetical protein